MRFRGSPCAPFGALLLALALTAPALAAGPQAAPTDPRRTWVGERGTFRWAGPGRWVEVTPSGQVAYRENDRQRDYIELYEPAGRRYLRLYAAGQYVYVPQKEHFRWVGGGAWEDRGPKPLDLTRNASDRGQLCSADQRRSFPRLGDNFEVMAPAASTYNCICWSLGANTSWVWPRPGGQPVTLSDFDWLYRLYGFRRVAGLDYSVQEGVEKVVLFALRGDDGQAVPTHACRQLSDGTWSSKLGSLPLIRHLKPEDVAGPTYGAPYVMYVRAKTR